MIFACILTSVLFSTRILLKRQYDHVQYHSYQIYIMSLLNGQPQLRGQFSNSGGWLTVFILLCIKYLLRIIVFIVSTYRNGEKSIRRAVVRFCDKQVTS